MVILRFRKDRSNNKLSKVTIKIIQHFKSVIIQLLRNITFFILLAMSFSAGFRERFPDKCVCVSTNAMLDKTIPL